MWTVFSDGIRQGLGVVPRGEAKIVQLDGRKRTKR
jgi:hypothetical protein